MLKMAIYDQLLATRSKNIAQVCLKKCGCLCFRVMNICLQLTKIVLRQVYLPYRTDNQRHKLNE